MPPPITASSIDRKGPRWPLNTGDKKTNVMQLTAQHILAEPRWNLAFLGILSYMFVEYTRLPQMYRVLQPLQLGKVLIVVAAVGWLTSGHIQSPPGPGSRSMDFAILGFLVACFGSVLFAANTGTALAGFIVMCQWAVVYFLISRILLSSWRLRIFVLLLLLLCLKLSQFEIRGYFTELGFGRSEEFISKMGEGAGSTDFFGNGGDFGVAMCMVWPLAGSLFFGEPKKLTKLFLFGCFIFFLISIFLCGSRGAVVGAAAVALASWAKQPKRIVGLAMLLFLLVGSVYVLPDATKDRLLSTSTSDSQADETGQMRMRLWKAGIGMFLDHPLFGIGVGNFGRVYQTDYEGDTSTPRVYAPHSIYVQALSETGLAGSLPLLMLWLSFLRINSRTRRHLKALGIANRKSFEYRLSIGLDLAFIGYMVSGAFITVLYYPHLWYLLGLCAALHSSALRRQPEAPKDEPGKPVPAFALASC